MSGSDRDGALTARKIAVVLAATMILWMGAQMLGGWLNLPVALAFAFDAMALAAFTWALVVTFQLRRRRGMDGPGPRG